MNIKELKELRKVPIQCQGCGSVTSNMKRYTLSYMENYVIMFRSGSSDFVACPKCARKVIWKHALHQLPRQHFIWPFYCFPVTIFQTIKSFIPGNSITVCRDLENHFRNS